MFDLYFTLRLLQELKRADEARDSVERLVHLQACRYFRSLLSVSESVRRVRACHGDRDEAAVAGETDAS